MIWRAWMRTIFLIRNWVSWLRSFVKYFGVLQVACRTSSEDPEAQRAIDLLYDTALISSGFTVSSISTIAFFCRYSQYFNSWNYIYRKSNVTYEKNNRKTNRMHSMTQLYDISFHFMKFKFNFGELVVNFFFFFPLFAPVARQSLRAWGEDLWDDGHGAFWEMGGAACWDRRAACSNRRIDKLIYLRTKRRYRVGQELAPLRVYQLSGWLSASSYR